MANLTDLHISSLLHSTLKQNQTRVIQDPRQADRIQTMLAQFDCGVLQEKLEQLDLSSVATSLASPQGQGWTERQTHLAIARYLLFLFVSYLHPSQILVPPKEVDFVWHEHLLQDTRKYARDCEMLFNGFVHHAEESQLWENATEENSRIAYQQTRSLIRQYLQSSEDDLARELLVQEQQQQDKEKGACGHPV
ncbi:MAG: hypothetical protein J7647_05775 [Cyanobacteria bacterium SBLK]|nr:hypothetical protein [Cyanobacteria bacterium SBLK]